MKFEPYHNKYHIQIFDAFFCNFTIEMNNAEFLDFCFTFLN